MPPSHAATHDTKHTMERRNAFIVIGCIILIVAVLLYLAFGSSFKKGNGTATSTPVSTSASGCPGCIGADLNGKSITMMPNSRITLMLPDATFNENALTITPTGLLREIPGAASQDGLWARTFEAVKEGDATIMVAPKSASAAPFILQIHIEAQGSAPASSQQAQTPAAQTASPGASPVQNMTYVVTPAHNGRTVYVDRGVPFYLELGPGVWNLYFDPQGSIMRVPGSPMGEGMQGLFEGVRPGTTQLRAVGACNTSFCYPPTVVVSFIVR